MCGICAIISSDPAIAGKAISTMCDAQVHRGPDDQGTAFVDNTSHTVGLGQRRLSIIDLSALGHQPMVHPQTGDILSYNGELYNFLELREQLETDHDVRFKGRSDTEVILHALVQWGPACFERFEGMFALAFYQRESRTLLLARDPLGIKPLYYAAGPGQLLVASELRAIIATGLVSKAISQQSVAGLMAYGSVPEPGTLFEDIHAFPPGHYARINTDLNRQTPRLRPRPHWRMPSVDASLAKASAEHDAAAQIASTLDRAVRNHLISDVPVGIFLSSGLDSTIIAALAARHVSDVRTFTVGFADQPDMSESPMASQTARELGLPFADIQILGSEAQSATAQWIQSVDQPSVDGLNSYVISKAVRDEGIVVALSGLGGDELLGGYRSFQDVPRLRRSLKRLAWMPPALRARAMELACLTRPATTRHKAGDLARSGASVRDLALGRRQITSCRRLRALGLDPQALGLSAAYLSSSTLDRLDYGDDQSDIIAAVSRYEAGFYMSNMLLRDSDTTGMAHSLEIRVPMIDRTMLDLCFALPGHVRLPRGVADKHLLRVAFKDILRDDLLKQSKRGFHLPIRRWMQGELRELCESSLTRVKSLELLERVALDQLWSDFLAQPETPVWSSAFTAIVLGAYLERLNISCS
jgi:asparagine synthase (glutamine-hydrolysing)